MQDYLDDNLNINLRSDISEDHDNDNDHYGENYNYSHDFNNYSKKDSKDWSDSEYSEGSKSRKSQMFDRDSFNIYEGTNASESRNVNINNKDVNFDNTDKIEDIDFQEFRKSIASEAASSGKKFSRTLRIG